MSPPDLRPPTRSITLIDPSDTTSRWELVDPRRRIIAWRHPDNFDDTRRWHYINPILDRTIEPYRDDETIKLADDLIDPLIICRSGSTTDAGAQLSVIANLIARLPESTIRHRYSDYVACRKKMSDN